LGEHIYKKENVVHYMFQVFS